jgi:hypothetical protein
LASGVRVEARDGQALLSLDTRARVRLFARRGAAELARWVELPTQPLVRLDELTLVVVPGAGGGSWLFRAPRSFAPGESAEVDGVLAADVASVGGRARRHYVYGDRLPELGWLNPHQRRRGLGLDGWIHAALAEPAAAPDCGLLAPAPAARDRICRRAEDGALECRVSLQPELAQSLGVLTELLALRPQRMGRGAHPAPPTRASFALLRGDSGEILARGDFVPGRASAVYAPTSAAAELRLTRLREDRDPGSGERLPEAQRGEASGEQVEWNLPVAAGSTLKPVVARAVERADPLRARWLVLHGEPAEGGLCPNGRGAPIYGHCPASGGMWNHPGELDLVGFLAHSANWFQAALGLVGTALPNGEIGFGSLPALPTEIALARGVGEPTRSERLWTAQHGRRIIQPNGGIEVAALRESPMWREFERLVGRPLCRGGDRRRCRAEGARRDLCAARGMPIAEPSRDLRHLVAIGPDRFDFFPELSDPAREVARVSTLEYLQFLRGSALHPLGSLLQLTDIFNRVVFEGNARDSQRRYHLAASWFPVPAAVHAPWRDCSGWRSGDPIQDGLCEVVRSGTAAAALGRLLADPHLVIYGAKTGTIDTLADVAENAAACERWRSAHTMADRPRRAADQPYWLRCADRAGAEMSDSLLLLSFGVRSGGDIVPLTLGLRFERSGPGFAAGVAQQYLEVVRDYFSAGEATR